MALLVAPICARQTAPTRSAVGQNCPQAPDVARLAAVAHSLAKAQLAPGIIPGLSVAVARNGRVVFACGYG